ncbi:hypothetical protein ElyMa_001966200 [Elysia marginata]|uniref:Uncharacterized protein n=1 Tax=Elysia marginata TaxID=1093978 RepID=A0AAV4EYS8_9GAST|nr:hypothetical protein ElyMa_001966200 [Elysia marginata]
MQQDRGKPVRMFCARLKAAYCQMERIYEFWDDLQIAEHNNAQTQPRSCAIAARHYVEMEDPHGACEHSKGRNDAWNGYHSSVLDTKDRHLTMFIRSWDWYRAKPTTMLVKKTLQEASALSFGMIATLSNASKSTHRSYWKWITQGKGRPAN